MFLHQCGDCGERWYIGNPKTCKCPDETPQRTEQEPVIDKSAAIRIATALGWEPKREWVGLTDEEIEIIYAECNVWDKFEYERMLEAKLKEKNT